MSRRRRHREFHHPLWFLGAMCIAMASAYWIMPPIPRTSRSLAQPEVPASGEPLPVRAAAAERGSGRPAYRHSVIAGGAYSVEEVERARRGDPVVNAHYAVFDAARLRMTEAPAPRSVYVSYRTGRKIYWTRNRVRLAGGEALITDGEHVARARCGNRVADTPQQPVEAEEPPAAELDVVEWPVPAEAESRLPSALVVDLFPPAPLNAIALSGAAKPRVSSSPPFWVSGGGIGLGTGAGVAPVTGAITGRPGPASLVPGPWPTTLPIGWPWPLPGPIVIAPPLPNPWLPPITGFPVAPPVNSGPTAGGGQSPIGGASGTIPLPGSSGLPATLPSPPGVAGGATTAGGMESVAGGATASGGMESAAGGATTTGGTQGLVLPPPIPVLPPPDTPVGQVPEPGTVILVVTGLALVVISAILRRR